MSIRKIVLVASWLKNYITQEHYTFAKNLTNYGWKLLNVEDANIEDIKKHKSIVLCVTYDEFDLKLLKCDNILIIYKIDDLYPFKKIRQRCLQDCDVVIGAYYYLFNTVKNMYKNITDIPGFWVPYSAVNKFYEDIEFNNSPVEKILISGFVNKVYPFREFMVDNEDDRMEILKHPGYQDSSHNVTNKNYYKRLNKYLCCFCDSSKFHYVLLKVFEITSVGSLLLVDNKIKKPLKELGFEDKVNCIICNKSNVFKKIDWIFDENNRKEVDKIRKAGMKLTRSRHNTEERSNMFNEIAKKLTF
jgi:hypothetical protein